MVPNENPWRRKGMVGDAAAFFISVRAFFTLIRTVRPLRYQAVIHLVVVPIGFARGFSATAWALYAIVSVFALYGEMNNSVHEQGADRHLDDPSQYDEGVKQIKDLAAGTVAAACLAYLVVVGILIAYPHS